MLHFLSLPKQFQLIPISGFALGINPTQILIRDLERKVNLASLMQPSHEFFNHRCNVRMICCKAARSPITQQLQSNVLHRVGLKQVSQKGLYNFIFSFLSIIRKCLFLRRNIPASKPTSAFKWNFLEDGILGPLQFVRLENDSLWSNFKKATDGFQDWLILLETRAFVESNLFYITLSNNFLTNFNANSFILKVLSCYSVVIENK